MKNEGRLLIQPAYRFLVSGDGQIPERKVVRGMDFHLDLFLVLQE